MKKLHFLSILVLVTSLFIASCSSNDNNTVDTEKPIIILKEPINDEIFAPGTEIHFDADFSDNVALGSYKIDIHNASDGHTHTRSLKTETTTTAAWTYSQTYTIEGDLKNTHVHHHIAIPTEINGIPITEGIYHLGVYLVDKAGNQQQIFVEIVIGKGGEEHVHIH